MNPEYAAGLNNLGGILEERGEHAAAEVLFREALRLKQGIPGAGEEVARAYNNLGQVLYGRGDLAAAEPYLRQGLAMRRRLLGSEPHPDLATSLNNLASLLEAKKDRAGAETLYREVLGCAASCMAIITPRWPGASAISHLCSWPKDGRRRRSRLPARHWA